MERKEFINMLKDHSLIDEEGVKRLNELTLYEGLQYTNIKPGFEYWDQTYKIDVMAPVPSMKVQIFSLVVNRNFYVSYYDEYKVRHSITLPETILVTALFQVYEVKNIHFFRYVKNDIDIKELKL
jgi:hypothetical protein